MNELTSLLVGPREWMLFVDGENFTKRAQAVLEAASTPPTPGPNWRRDVFMWLPGHSATWPFFSHGQGTMFMGRGDPSQVTQAHRAYYYTSAATGEPQWTETRLALREIGFEPRLFRRVAGRSKAVDVALATDVLSLGAEGRYEVAVIFAGDGDYVPVVEAVKRFGLHAVVGFFESDGLSPELRIAADDCVDLTPSLVRAWGSRDD